MAFVQGLDEFLENELSGLFKREPTRKEQIKQDFLAKNDLLFKFGFQSVKGDGRCLIRALLVLLTVHHSEHLKTRLSLFGLVEDANLIESLVNTIKEKWTTELSLTGEWFYHMDETAIDGLAVIALMKILGISTLNVFQFIDGADRQAGWREIKSDLKEGIECNIATVNGCHYTAII